MVWAENLLANIWSMNSPQFSVTVYLFLYIISVNRWERNNKENGYLRKTYSIA
jgi:hypothetical protein